MAQPAGPKEGAVLRAHDGATYEVGERIGSGGFGSVFRSARIESGSAVDGDWPNALALKWQPRTPGSENEGRLHRQLVHRCVVRCLAAWDDGDGLYAILEYCANGSLRDLIERCVAHRDEAGGHALLESAGPGGRDHFELLLCDMVDALAYCGRLGVVHCDIKPENILVDEGWTFKLADFGLSSVLARRSDYGTLGGARGTLSYMAPEVFAAFERGEKVHFSAWTDSYSLGLTLLQALRLSLRPVLGGKEDARRFHEMRKNVEVEERDHSKGPIRQALRVMLRHKKESRSTAEGVLEVLSEEGTFAVSTAQSLASLFSRLRLSAPTVRGQPAPLAAAQAAVSVTVSNRSPSVQSSAAERQLDHAGARAFWNKRHDANSTQWDWTNFSDCLFGEWRSLSSRANELKRLLVPPGRDDVPMAWLNNAVSQHASLSLGEALAQTLQIGSASVAVATPTASVAVATPTASVAVATPTASVAVAMPDRLFDRALRAFHAAPFQFMRARVLFTEVLADRTATEMEKARANLSLRVLFGRWWGSPFEDKVVDAYEAAAAAGMFYLLRAGDECDPVRAFEMGYCHYWGIGTKQDMRKAHSLFLSSANGGCAAGIYYLGSCVYFGDGVPVRSKSAGLEHWEKAAAMGHSGAMFSLGECLFRGTEGLVDRERGVALIRSAAVDEGDWYAKKWLAENKAKLEKMKL